MSEGHLEPGSAPDAPEAPPTLQGGGSNPAGADAGDPSIAALRARAYQLLQQGQKGASWFFWVAGMSVVNSIIIHTGGKSHFVLGLGVTMIADSIAGEFGKQAPKAATIATVIAVAFDVFVTLLVIGAGLLARRRYIAVYAAGMFAYLLDGLLFLAVGDLMSVAIHALALFYMFHGLTAFRKLNAILRAAPA